MLFAVDVAERPRHGVPAWHDRMNWRALKAPFMANSDAPCEWSTVEWGTAHQSVNPVNERHA
jgi:hypothetical protein